MCSCTLMCLHLSNIDKILIILLSFAYGLVLPCLMDQTAPLHSAGYTITGWVGEWSSPRDYGSSYEAGLWIWLCFLVLVGVFLLLIDGLLLVCGTLMDDVSVVIRRIFLIRFGGWECGSGLLSSSNFSTRSRVMCSAWSIDLYCGVPRTVSARKVLRWSRDP